jgi:hypothetical protein
VLPSTIATVDYHTGGEPFRIVVDSPVSIPGSTVAGRRTGAIENANVQGLRTLLSMRRCPRLSSGCRSRREPRRARRNEFTMSADSSTKIDLEPTAQSFGEAAARPPFVSGLPVVEGRKIVESVRPMPPGNSLRSDTVDAARLEEIG